MAPALLPLAVPVLSLLFPAACRRAASSEEGAQPASLLERSTAGFPLAPALTGLLAARSPALCRPGRLTLLALSPGPTGDRVRGVPVDVEGPGPTPDEATEQIRARFERMSPDLLEDRGGVSGGDGDTEQIRKRFERLAPDLEDDVSQTDNSESVEFFRQRYERLIPDSNANGATAPGRPQEPKPVHSALRPRQLDEAQKRIAARGRHSFVNRHRAVHKDGDAEAQEGKMWAILRNAYHRRHGPKGSHSRPETHRSELMRQDRVLKATPIEDIWARRRALWTDGHAAAPPKAPATATAVMERPQGHHAEAPTEAPRPKPPMEPREGEGSIVLLRDWVQNFAPDSVEVWRHWTKPVMRHGMPDIYSEGTARYGFGDQSEVAFSVRRTMAPETVRDLHARRLLRSSGCTPTLLEDYVCTDLTYQLTEPAGNVTLEQLIQYRMRHHTDGPLLPLGECLPLMADLLRGIDAMEKFGMVHANLDEFDIAVFPQDGSLRAVYTDFRNTCQMNVQEPRLWCTRGIPVHTGSLYRHAPEMQDDRPTGVSNNVWQLGLIFARMLLGGPVATLEEAERTGVADIADESTHRGRLEIQSLVRSVFSIRHSPAYKRLAPEYADVLAIVEGMLEKEPSKRWSPSQALQAVERVARDRHVPVSPQRQPAKLPAEWQGFQK